MNCFWCDVRGGGPGGGAVRGAVLEVASGRHSRSKHQGYVVINKIDLRTRSNINEHELHESNEFYPVRKPFVRLVRFVFK